MTVRILALSSPGEVRAVAVQDGELLDLAIHRPGCPDGVGDVYRGRVTVRVPAMAGAFVALGGPVDGFLPDSEGAAGLHDGDPVTAVVTRAAQGGKGPRLSAKGAPDAGAGPPSLLRRGPDAVERLAALYPDASVLVDDPALAAALRPALGSRVALGAVLDGTLADALAALEQPAVALPGGLRASIHPTPALVAIDVDMGPATAERRDKAGAQLAANRAALPALARQIRLRNLSGAILLDLAGLSVRRRAELGPDLERALLPDPLGPRFLGFTRLGLAELQRRRGYPPLHELLATPHAAGLAALRRLVTDAAQRPGTAFALRASPSVVAALQADPVALADVTRRTGRTLTLRSDAAISGQGWAITETTHG